MSDIMIGDSCKLFEFDPAVAKAFFAFAAALGRPDLVKNVKTLREDTNPRHPSLAAPPKEPTFIVSTSLTGVAQLVLVMPTSERIAFQGFPEEAAAAFGREVPQDVLELYRANRKTNG